MDMKAAPRIMDSALLRALHREWKECAVCLRVGRLSLHHILKRPRDDVRGNLVMLCGDGVRGCHGRVEAHDAMVVKLLGEHIASDRDDVVAHLVWRLGESGAREFARRQLLVTIL